MAAKGKGPTTEVPWGHAAQEADTDSGMSGAGGSSSALQPTAGDQPVRVHVCECANAWVQPPPLGL